MSTTNTTEGVKHDQGKNPLELLPFDALEEIGKVLAFGARKYTRRAPITEGGLSSILTEGCTCGVTTKSLSATLTDPTQQRGCVSLATRHSTQKPSVPSATKGVSPMSGVCVDPVMTASSRAPTQTTHVGSERQMNGGSPRTMAEKLTTAGATGHKTESSNELLSVSVPTPSHDSDSPSKTKCESSNPRTGGAPSAESPRTGCSTSTMTTSPVSSGGSSATDATKVLVSWETMQRHLNVHSPTCDLHRVIVIDEDTAALVIAGARNWEKGMDWSRVYGALLRHLFSWWRGYDKDPETGLSHLAHAGCCVLFLLAYTLRNVGKDDRP